MRNCELRKGLRINGGEHFLNLSVFYCLGFLQAKNKKYLKSVHVKFTEKKLQYLETFA